MGSLAYLLPNKDVGVVVEWTMDGVEFRFETPHQAPPDVEEGQGTDNVVLFPK